MTPSGLGGSLGAKSNGEAAGPQFRTNAERSSKCGRNGTGLEDAPVPERLSAKRLSGFVDILLGKGLVSHLRRSVPPVLSSQP